MPHLKAHVHTHRDLQGSLPQVPIRPLERWPIAWVPIAKLPQVANEVDLVANVDL